MLPYKAIANNRENVTKNDHYHANSGVKQQIKMPSESPFFIRIALFPALISGVPTRRMFYSLRLWPEYFSKYAYDLTTFLR